MKLPSKTRDARATDYRPEPITVARQVETFTMIGKRVHRSAADITLARSKWLEAAKHKQDAPNADD